MSGQAPPPAHFPPPGALEYQAPRATPWSTDQGGPGDPGFAAPGGISREHPGLTYGAAHKPGAVPLRPLKLGDIFDAAIKVVRFNPRATAVPALLMTTGAMVLPLLFTALFVFGRGHTIDLTASDPFQDSFALLGPYGAVVAGSLIIAIGTMVLSGLIAVVTHAAALGHRPTLSQAWAGTRGRRWSLIGLVTLSILTMVLIWVGYAMTSALVLANISGGAVLLWFLLTGPAVLALVIFLTVRLAYLATAAMMIERLGIRAALRRAWRLSRGQGWRIFGIALLTAVVAQMGAGMLSAPLTIGGEVAGFLIADGRYLMFFLVLGQTLAQIVSSVFVIPFNAAVTALLYLDQRIRKEAYDVELMTAAGITRA